MTNMPDHVARARHERVTIADYDPKWPIRFAEEATHLRQCLPAGLIGRIEHFGSTAVPGLSAKPIIDMMIEIPTLEEVASRVAPILRAQGYEYFWRPRAAHDPRPAYTWFIKREASGRRTHHLHFLEPGAPDWNRLAFRDYLIAHPALAREYDALKRRIAAEHPDDRIAYARAKTAFIERVNALARDAPG